MTKEQWIEFFEQNRDYIEDNRDYLGGVLRKAREYAHDDKSIDCGSGASKAVLIDLKDNVVLKWAKPCSNSSENFDESYAEYEIYQDAVEKGLECFFPKTEVLIEFEGFAIVMQERVKFAYCDIPYKELEKLEAKHSTVKEKIIKKARNGFFEIHRAPREKWLRIAISYYGKQKMKQLCQFTKEHQINDLHQGNIGFSLSLAPVILDFSGYHRGW